MVVANSEHTKRMLLERWQLDGRRVAVMHPGVDTSRFKPAPLDDNIRAKSGWRDRRVLLTVGALQKRKGQDMLIRALPAIRARCPDVLYAIIGEGWERPYLERLAADSGVADVVQFRGAPSDDELIACYQQCDLFVLPNRQVGWDFEGFGIALIEAQACGKPVVTGVSGGTRETLDVSRTGELVACETPGAVATAVADLLDDSARRARMGAAARTWAVERFDWAVLTREAQELFAPDGACK
jgi:phosphatidylinositol alpha-1,6-mannosyltransferase